MNVIFGAAGFAKEVEWLIDELNQLHVGHNQTHVDFFVGKENLGEFISDKPILSDDQFHEKIKDSHVCNVFIAIGSPNVRKKVQISLIENSNIQYPILIHPSVQYDKRPNKVEVLEGTIICAGSILTTNIKIGAFVHINLDCTIGHDSIIGSFTTVSPGCHISGNVTIGEGVFLGTGVTVLEKLNIASGAIIGAGSVVTKDITEAGTYVGIPAKKIK